MSEFSSGVLTGVDAVLLVLIVIVLPLEALVSHRQTRAKLASDEPGIRLKLYREALAVLWGTTLPILLIWVLYGRDWADLGFNLSWDGYDLLAWALASVPVAFFASQLFYVSRSAKGRALYRDELGKDKVVSNFLPHTREEYRTFRLVGVTAGITEEIIFRGYLIWALSLFLPFWIGVCVSLILFVLMHLYQGMGQLPVIFLTGAWLTAVVLISGSLWPAIALHISIDVLNNEMIWIIRNRVEDSESA